MNKSSPKSIINDVLLNTFKYPRSLTGEGSFRTLKYIQNIIPIKLRFYRSGTKVYDWIIPREWVLKEAYIEIDGKRYIDVKDSILHVVNYSVKINKLITWNELKGHLYSHDTLGDAIPYVTSYYQKNWGFCITKKQYEHLQLKSKEKKIRVVIDSYQKNGRMYYGDLHIPGKSKKEILISSYICHPEMANDSLSGVALCVALARKLLSTENYFSYRFTFVPETIGAIGYIKRLSESNILKQIYAGIVCTTTGGTGNFSCKKSFDNTHEINDILDLISKKYSIEQHSFDVHGSDERQYSSNGARINCISIYKDKFYDYSYYHTSLDDLNFVKPDNIYKTYKIYCEFIKELEKRTYYKSTIIAGEPMLSKYGLYNPIGGKFRPGKVNISDICLQLMFYSDGKTSIEKISNITNVSLMNIKKVAKVLVEKGLLVET